MSKRTTLKSLVAPDFADGFAAFEDFDSRAAQMAAATDLPADKQAALRINHLLTVAMAEGLNDAEEDFGVEPLEAMYVLWRNVGVALATMTAQAFSSQDGKVRAEMQAAVMGGYDGMTKAIATARALEAEGGAK